MRRDLCGIITTLFLLAPLTAVSQEDTTSEQFQLQTLDYQHAAHSVFGVATTDQARRLEPIGDLVLEFADEPAVATVTRGDESREVAIVDDRWLLDGGVAFGLTDRLQLDARFLAVLSQRGTALSDVFEGAATSESMQLGDLRIGAAYRVSGRARGIPIGVAVRTTAWLPTGSVDGYASDGTFRIEPRLIVDAQLGPLTLAANGGYQVRAKRIASNFRNDDVVRWGTAARLPVVGEFGLDASLFGAHSFFDGRDPDEPTLDAPNTKAHPIEFVAGPWWRAAGFHTFLGFGRGVTDGVGAPNLRVVLGVGYQPSGREGWAAGGADPDAMTSSGGTAVDADGDGVPNDDDACPYDAEDVDRFEDADGCPDLDDDDDGIADAEDACRLEPGVAKKQGCPLVDADGDGIDDTTDQCPEVAEDLDRFEDADGCPDPDNDGDGIADASDQCPMEPEVVNGNADDDGCPDEGTSLVTLDGDRIEILERVYFDTARATIKQRSFAVLQQVAAVLKNRPEIVKLSIVGHTDAEGSATSNLELSRRRARAVREFLETQGIAPDRLTDVGFGESHPLADNATAEGRATNRRVEFLITRRAPAEGGTE